MVATGAVDPWQYSGLLNGRPVRVLFDSGAAANFLSARIADELGLTLVPPRENDVGYARMPNGTRSVCKATGLLSLRIGGHHERLALNATSLDGYDVILGQAWLCMHNPIIDWRDGRAVIKRRHNEVVLYPAEVANSEDTGPQNSPLSAMQFGKALTRGDQAFVAILRPVDRDRPMAEDPARVHAGDAVDRVQDLDRHGTPVKGTVSKLQNEEQQRDHACVASEVTRSARTDGPTGLPDDIPADLRDILRTYSDVFPAALPAGLPPKREVDHGIELEPGALPPSRPTYRMSFLELEELEKQLKEYSGQWVD